VPPPVIERLAHAASGVLAAGRAHATLGLLAAGALAVFGPPAAGALAAAAPPAAAASAVKPACASLPPPPRVVRYLSPRVDDGARPSFGLVLEDAEGVPVRVLNLTAWGRDAGPFVAYPAVPRPQLHDRELALAERLWARYRKQLATGTLAGDPLWDRYADVLAPADLPRTLCAPIALDRLAIDAGERMVVAAADPTGRDAGPAARAAGTIALVPKPVPPTGPYRTFHAPPWVELIDYGVALAFVVLEDVDLGALPSASELEERSASGLARDVSDRAALIRRRSLLGRSTGVAEAKALPGFMPLGPWMVHGRHARLFTGDCIRSRRMSLTVETAGRAELRQFAETGRLLLEPRALLDLLPRPDGAAPADALRSPLPIAAGGLDRFYPLARLGETDGHPAAILPRGSIVLMGSPPGGPRRDPALLPLLARALVSWRPPAERLLDEQRAERRRLGYLDDGDVVVAAIEDLGTQRWAVARGEPDGSATADPCGG
jgi:2-keto-4-pentenoate hydratase/2-oxohepta-3-ene-1,7-dioic acid hydratase in catechol pathway